ncbi:hypothetical protein DFA_05595 [Cavenderia fasciculata]|uniref:H(+)-transporting two-sector ATPase n=1 Tax=Cavenderia fasciculata TaxID=261658 RepID=F4PLP0_CACFS|nr:uncharacterized protein DFA_05595 [Cavenderia fasciculata]EGG23462.1 hypothetical protein DFA_05595 [Cavenderia fasciculata]|eukprot:XP_004361313.1 hypothetical protein DFA_05595 [Cavenderia fasciculata]
MDNIIDKEEEEDEGIILGISTCIVTAKIDGVTMNECVRVGSKRLLGEVVAIKDDKAFIQMYEPCHGLENGGPVIRTYSPLMVELGPGLLSSVFDGIQRPLSKLSKNYLDALYRPDKINQAEETLVDQQQQQSYSSSIHVPLGETLSPLDRNKLWHFEPVYEYVIGTPVTAGDIIGRVQETPLFVHWIMVPPNVIGGRIIDIASEGDYNIEHPLAMIEIETYDSSTSTTSTSIIPVTMLQKWPARKQRPFVDRLVPNEPHLSGYRVLDSFFPCAKGGSAVISGYAGLGKSMISYQLSTFCQTDVVVHSMCGRSTDVAELIMEYAEVTSKDPQKLIDSQAPYYKRKYDYLIDKTVLIGDTPVSSAGIREASILVAVTISEYFRDMGYDVTTIVDSLSRWGDALKEISQCLGEMAGPQGYPLYLGSRLASFYARAGKVSCLGRKEREGSVSLFTMVSPPASNGGYWGDHLSVTCLDTANVFWALDPALIRKRQYPAIHWLHSYSKDIKLLQDYYTERGGEDFLPNITTVKAILAKEEELQDAIITIGKSSLPHQDNIVLDVAQMVREYFLAQNLFAPYDLYSTIEKSSYLIRSITLFYKRFIQWYNQHKKELVNKDYLQDIHRNRQLQSLTYKMTTMKFKNEFEEQKEMFRSYKEIIQSIDTFFDDFKLI